MRHGKVGQSLSVSENELRANFVIRSLDLGSHLASEESWSLSVERPRFYVMLVLKLSVESIFLNNLCINV